MKLNLRNNFLIKQLRDPIMRLSKSGPYIALAIIFLWFGLMKFTAYEAGAIHGLVKNSYFLFFLDKIFSVQGTSNLIGLIEICIGLLIAGRYFSPEYSLLGGIGAAFTFLLTMSFFFSTPGVGLENYPLGAISVLPGQFLLKDLGLFFLSLYIAADSLRAIEP